jgi:hypothetical protein
MPAPGIRNVVVRRPVLETVWRTPARPVLRLTPVLLAVMRTGPTFFDLRKNQTMFVSVRGRIRRDSACRSSVDLGSTVRNPDPRFGRRPGPDQRTMQPLRGDAPLP